MSTENFEEFEDVEFDETDDEGANALAGAQKKLKKLKDELAACKQEKQEYLDGWQRLRADVANTKKESGEAGKRVEEKVREGILEDLIPVMDSFDMAFRGEAWSEVDEAWRKGVEYIHSQFEGALTQHGVRVFGAIGERFDPVLHDAAEEREGGEPGVILEVLQRGYKLGGKVVRPARVAVGK